VVDRRKVSLSKTVRQTGGASASWKKSMKKIKIASGVFIATLIIAIIFVYYSTEKYNASEKDVHKELTNECLLSAIAFKLAEYYEKTGGYPPSTLINAFIFDAGYPANLGCGETSISKEPNITIVDVNGNAFIYQYISPEFIKIYFKNKKSIAYVLAHGGLARGDNPDAWQ
jgi:hypothetical protein